MTRNIKTHCAFRFAALALCLGLVGCGGSAGPAGPQGPAGPSGLTVSSVRFCAGTDSTTYGISVYAEYQIVGYSNGDKMVTCSMSNLQFESTGSAYWRASQNSAQQASCSVTFDVDTPTGGWFEFRNDGGERAIYHDLGSPYDGVVSAFAASACSTTNALQTISDLE